jgi:3-oxoacyl-[acyl-carrier-protein] synthase-1
MQTLPLAVLRTGLVTPVGLSAPASCAAFRAKLTNPTPTHFADAAGEWIMAHQVPLPQPLRGLPKLARMAAMAIAEALQDIAAHEWNGLPLLLCVAQAQRPGRPAGLDDELFLRIQSELGVVFGDASAVVPQGRIGVALALAKARELVAQGRVNGRTRRVLVAAVDSLLSWPMLEHCERAGRLLTPANSNGFMPGEAAGALLLGEPDGGPALVCTGIGFGRESATIESEAPLRADGLVQAIRAALAQAGRQMHEMDFRITDDAGEQYYFKEGSLALSRLLRVRKEAFDIWHPAECTGEVGAASGATILAAALAACEKRYAIGPDILVHLGDDDGPRAALCLQYRGGA